MYRPCGASLRSPQLGECRALWGERSEAWYRVTVAGPHVWPCLLLFAFSAFPPFLQLFQKRGDLLRSFLLSPTRAVNDFLVSQSITFFLLCAIYALCDYAQSAESIRFVLCDYAQSAANANLERSDVRR